MERALYDGIKNGELRQAKMRKKGGRKINHMDNSWLLKKA